VETKMKVSLAPCLKCQEEKPERQYWIKGAELRDDLAFHLECPLGHKSVIIYNAPKFEILFDMGVSALLDGYGREAVSSFAATQERFHEFGIKVLLAKQNVSKEQFLATWKLVASQSERQLGAYYFLYLLQFNAPAPTSSKRVEFRNNVIHKGYIPTSTEAADYAEYVYDYIVGTLKTMQPPLSPQIHQVCKDDLEEMLRSIPADVAKGVPSMAAPTMIQLLGPEEQFGKHSFRDALKKRKEEHRDELADRLEDFVHEDEEASPGHKYWQV
jgi:hypothetical protein